MNPYQGIGADAKLAGALNKGLLQCGSESDSVFLELGADACNACHVDAQLQDPPVARSSRSRIFESKPSPSFSPSRTPEVNRRWLYLVLWKCVISRHIACSMGSIRRLSGLVVRLAASSERPEVSECDLKRDALQPLHL